MLPSGTAGPGKRRARKTELVEGADKLLEQAVALGAVRPIDGLPVAMAALDAARATGDAVRIGEAALETARCQWRLGDLASAGRYMEIALDIFERGGQRRRLGVGYKLHAMLFITADKVSLALTAALKALGYPDLTASDRMYLYATVAMCFHHLVDLPTGGRVLEERAWPEAQLSQDPPTIVACASRCAGLNHDLACWALDIPSSSTVGADKPPLEPATVYLQRAREYLVQCDAHLADVTGTVRDRALGLKAMVLALDEGWERAQPVFEHVLQTTAHLPFEQMMTLLSAGTSARITGQWELARDLLLRVRAHPAASSAHFQRLLAFELSYVLQALGDASAATEEMRRFAHLQTRKSRLAIEWISDAANKRRYGERIELSEAKALVFGRVQPAVVKRITQYIEGNLGKRLLLSDVAHHANVSARTLQSLFKSHHGLPISEFIRERRMQRADQLLRAGRNTVAEVALAIGYSSPANFSRDYRRRFGRVPSSVRPTD